MRIILLIQERIRDCHYSQSRFSLSDQLGILISVSLDKLATPVRIMWYVVITCREKLRHIDDCDKV